MPRDRGWTDRQLVQAVKVASGYGDVCRRLGLSGNGGGWWTVKARIAELGLDVAHFAKRRSSVDTTTLRAMVAMATSYAEVVRLLGLTLDASTHTRIRRRVQRHGIDTSHFVRHWRPGRPRSKLSDDQFRDAVARSKSIASVLRALGLIPAGGNYAVAHQRIEALGLDTSHFTGPGWNKGMQFVGPRRPLDQILVAGRPTGSHTLKLRLFSEGVKRAACELCGWAQRSPDGRVPVELDHINGDRNDNRLENLRVLCPNCHSLQTTHRGLNKRSRRK